MFSCPFVPQLTEHSSPFVLDDGSAKASSLVGTFLLVFSAVFVSTTVGHSIECLVPQTYSVEWAQYTESLCLRGNTYFWPVVWIGPNGYLKQPFTEEEKRANSTDFYAYISMMFAVLAGMSLAPKLVFQLLMKTTRVPLKRLATEALEAQKDSTEMRAERVKKMFDKFYNEIVTRKKTFGWWDVQIVLIISKALYHFSTVLQLCMLSSFLRFGDDLLWGWTLTYNYLTGITWRETGLFPRIVFCDVDIAKENEVGWHHHTVQCHLGVNYINEPLCILLWWWYCILAVVTLIGFLVELLNCNTIGSLKKLMNQASPMRRKKEKLQEFAEFLTPDGVFVLRFLEQISDMVTYEMAVRLWEKYESDHLEKGTTCVLGCSEVSVVVADETSL